MDKKARFILDTLQKLFPQPEIPLLHSSPYTLLIAVLLSGQCTDKRVNLVTPQLFARADTPKKMVQLPVAEIEKLIRSCGLAPQKAKAIHRLSEILLEKHAGRVPNSFEELEELPGVGHKTASVVMIQAFHQAAFPVDTHIHRLVKRWGLSSGKSIAQTEKDLKKAFPQKTWGLLHLQMIYYGRTFCPAQKHEIEKCPICLELLK